ncbi:MAG: CsiV family protein [Pseudomonadales bacterium]
MNNTITNLTTAALLLLATLVFAQDQDNDDKETIKWYQVELFIFANNNPDAASTERWPQELGLKYPESMVAFDEDNAFNTVSKDEILLLDLDSKKTLSTSELKQAEQLSHRVESSNKQIMPTENSQTTIQHDSQTLLDDPATTDNAFFLNAAPTVERPFTLLKKEQHQLTEVVERILAEADYRLLFHQAWRQPVGKRNEADSLLIRGGNQFDSHFELEGSINLSVARYLHLTTDLWLSTFVSSIGRDQKPWPVLPKAPTISVADTGQDHHTIARNNNAKDNSKVLLSFESPFVTVEGKQYSVERTVAMRQHRRMRSNELHYIDHPLIGLLIKIIPYEVPAIDQTEIPVTSHYDLAPSPAPYP